MISRDRLSHMSPASKKSLKVFSVSFGFQAFLDKKNCREHALHCLNVIYFFYFWGFWRDAFWTSSSLITSKANRSPSTTLPCCSQTHKPSAWLADPELLAAISFSAISTKPHWLRTERIAGKHTVHRGLMDRAGPSP